MQVLARGGVQQIKGGEGVGKMNWLKPVKIA